ncbi:MAG: 3-deoxy-D-manno-octulosonic acid transferase [Candidatus Omnitrophota bacterium]
MIIYDIFFFAFSIVYLPYMIIKGKAHKDLGQRFGKLPEAFKALGKTNPVWIHAVSVGEVIAVKNFIGAIQRKFHGKKIILSTTTRTGNEIARKILGDEILKFYFPLDFSFIVKRALDCLNPRCFIMMETEIWPNLILELAERKIPIILINGRISRRSFGGYSRIKIFFEKILKKVDLFCMQTESDARRIQALGAREENIRVSGNMKFDIPLTGEKYEKTKAALGIDEESQLLIAGSTHKGEDEIILEAYKRVARKFNNLRLLLAPRHIDRSRAIKRLVTRYGFHGEFFSDVVSSSAVSENKEAVLILDTLGELSKLYSLATIVFMGGTFVKRGGHNIIEPAVFGKPILFGPHMFNFRDMAKSFLEGDAAIRVRDGHELSEVIEGLLKDKDRRSALGENALRLLRRSRGATERNIAAVGPYITKIL